MDITALVVLLGVAGLTAWAWWQTSRSRRITVFRQNDFLADIVVYVDQIFIRHFFTRYPFYLTFFRISPEIVRPHCRFPERHICG